MKLKKRNWFFLILIIIVILICYKEYKDYKKEQAILEAKRIEKEKKDKYEKCLITKPIDEIDLSDKEKEIENSINKNSISIYYEDLTFNKTYSINEDKIYYGASLIKLVDALYLYDNNIDINLTKKYDTTYKKAYSSCMDKHIIGEEVSIKELVRCALSVSDNTAHMMLIDYIGFDNLKNYGKTLGAKNTLEGWDKFGNQSASDTNIYLKRAYEIMNSSEYGSFMKETMFNDHYGYLNLNKEINVAHKYGYYNEVFHDIGIVFDKHPYTLSVLTLHGNSNYETVINEIAKKINEYHQEYWTKIESNCYNSVYNQ